ncbi:MAG: 30S ribosomal protein S9 [bacterium]|nr:30S ribosomal protein S9 [bacterium]
MAARKPKEKNYIFAVGRRKTSTARVRLFKGKDQTLVNDLPFAQYFAGPTASKLLVKPFQVTETEGKYFVTAKTAGGGKNGQLEAVIHGIARALCKVDGEAFRDSLKKAGLLTRDPRTRQRRMVGMGGKSRRKRQSPKR